MSNVDDLNDRLCDLISAWFLHDGYSADVDGYYRARVKQRLMITPQEQLIADYVETNYSKTTVIAEVGAGYGQISFLLASLGYEVHAVEGAAWRKAGIKWMCPRIPEVGGRVHLVEGWYPRECSQQFDLLITTNVINSIWEDRKVQLTEALYTDALIDVCRWWRHRPTEHEQQQLVAEIQALGYLGASVGLDMWSFRKGVKRD